MIILGHRSAAINYPDCKKESRMFSSLSIFLFYFYFLLFFSFLIAQFWKYIRSQLSLEDISNTDLSILNILCTNEDWMDLIPKGLVSSYLYLYHSVRGLGCEDAESIEKFVLFF